MAENHNQNRDNQDDESDWKKGTGVRNAFQPVVPLAKCGRHCLNLLRQNAANLATFILGR